MKKSEFSSSFIWLLLSLVLGFFARSLFRLPPFLLRFRGSFLQNKLPLNEHGRHIAVIAQEDELVEDILHSVILKDIKGGAFHLRINQKGVEDLSNLQASDFVFQSDNPCSTHRGQMESYSEKEKERNVHSLT